MRQLKTMTVIITSALLIACSGNRPTTLGIQETRLAPCPSSPNCVSSYSTSEVHSIKPIMLNKALTAEQQMAILKEAIENTPGMEIIRTEQNYIYAEATTKLMRFVDDVEFLLDTNNNLVNVRSASRLGYKDFDANRNRIERIRNYIEKATQ